MLIGILAWTSLEKRGRLCSRQDSQKKWRVQIEELTKYSYLWQKELGWTGKPPPVSGTSVLSSTIFKSHRRKGGHLGFLIDVLVKTIPSLCSCFHTLRINWGIFSKCCKERNSQFAEGVKIMTMVKTQAVGLAKESEKIDSISMQRKKTLILEKVGSRGRSF